MVFIVSLVGVQAVPPGTGTVTQIVDVSLPTTLYMGKQYMIHGTALDVSDDPVANTSCAASSYTGAGATKQLIDRESIKSWCKDDKNCLPASNLPFECYYTTWGNGNITIPFYVSPILYNSGVEYTFELVCEDITVTATATVMGYSEKLYNDEPDTCNVDTVLIGDGTDATVDSFDENPNKLDVLNVDYSLTSLNTLCVNEKVSYKVLRDVNGTMINHKEMVETTTDINESGVIPLEIDGSYFVGGNYQLIVMADDKNDTVNFTVNKMRPLMESYETADWTIENMSGIMMWLVLIVALIFALLLLRGVMR